jgi:uncharacterized membrane protein
MELLGSVCIVAGVIGFSTRGAEELVDVEKLSVISLLVVVEIGFELYPEL